MERNQLVSRIRNLQDAAAKTNILSEQRQDFDKRLNELKRENANLKNKSAALESERNTFEKDIAVYIVENDNLKKQISLINSNQKKRDDTIADNIKEMKKNNENFIKLKDYKHSALVEKLDGEVTQSADEIKVCRDKISSLEKRCKDLSSSEQNLKHKNDQIYSEKSILQNKVQLLENKILTHEKTAVSSASKNDSYQRSLEHKLQSCSQEYQVKVKKLKEENQKLEMKVQELNKLQAAQSCIGKKIQDDVQRKNESLESEIIHGKKKYKELQQKYENVERQWKSATEDINMHQQEKQFDIEKLSSKISNLERNLADKTAKVSVEKEKNQRLEKRIAKTQTELDNSRTALNSKVDSTQNQIKRLMLENNEKKADIKALEDKCFEMSSSDQDAKYKIEQMTNEKRTLEKKSKELEAKVSTLVESMESTITKNQFDKKLLKDKLNASNKTYESKIEELIEENQKLAIRVQESKKLQAAQSCIGKKIQDDVHRKNELLEIEIISEKKKYKELRQKYNVLEDKCSEMSSSEQDANYKIKQMTNEKRTLAKKVKELESKNFNLVESTESTVTENEVNQKLLKEKLDASKRLHDSKIKELIEENQKLEIRVEESKKLQAAQSCIGKKFQDDVHRKNESLESEIIHGKKKYKELLQNYETVERQWKSATEDINLHQQEKQFDNETLTSKISNLERNLADKTAKVSKLQAELDSFRTALNSKEDSTQNEIRKLILDNKKQRTEIKVLEDKCFEMSSSEHDAKYMIEQMTNEKRTLAKKVKELETKVSTLVETMESTVSENEVNQKLLNDKLDDANNSNESKIEELVEVITDLKKTCFMMEEQVEDLEKFNDKLLDDQNTVTEERDRAFKSMRSLEKEIKEKNDILNHMKTEGNEMKMQKAEEMVQLQIAARDEANNAQELNDEMRSLEQKYNNLELHANSLQRKINVLKEENVRLNDGLLNAQSSLSHAEVIRQKCKDGLRTELKRAEELDQERTLLQNKLETLQMSKSHENIKLNCTLAQQSKLIDFLQARVEELEPHDSKKKKKKKNDLYQVPLQYHELQGLLDQEKRSNVELQEKINQFRTELQSSKAEATRLKHGLGSETNKKFLSPGSLAAISAIVRSPNSQNTTPKGSRQSKTTRMHHNIPHRLQEQLCTRAIKCSVCLDTVRFGRVALCCSECSITCHLRCRPNLNGTCGLPDGFVQHVKIGRKINTASPNTCVSSNETTVKGWLKVLCGQNGWERLWVEFNNGKLKIKHKDKAGSKSIANEEINLQQQNAYIHSTVPSSELDSTAKSDIPYAFKLEVGPMTSCWPPRSIYFLAVGYAEKQQWVKAIENVTMQNKAAINGQMPGSDQKILGNEIVTLTVNEKLEMNCSLPLASEHVLFGCDEGLFLLCPSKTSVRSRSDLVQISGVKQILQMSVLKPPNLFIAVEGKERQLVTFDLSQVVSKLKTGKTTGFDISVNLSPIEDVHNCHLFGIGLVEGTIHLCAATPTSVIILRHNDKLGKFFKRKEIGTTEPCTCLQFTKCSILMGTNKFYEIELKSYKVDEFLMERSLVQELDINSFPVTVILVSETSGRQEFLLCYHEFGVFVDGFGKKTRTNPLRWSRLPLSFAFSSPYLIVTHFYSVEILKIVSNHQSDINLNPPQSYLALPSPRFLGSAITPGAIYLSSNDNGKVTVNCCKGNMVDPPLPACDDDDKENFQVPLKSCLKRRHANAESSDDTMSLDSRRRSPSIDSQMTLQSRDFTDSCVSLASCESEWTLKSKRSKVPESPMSVTNKRIFRHALYHASCESLDSLDSVLTSEVTEDEGTLPPSPKDMWKQVNSPKTTPKKPARNNRGKRAETK